MKLSQLRALLHVAEFGSLVKAASRMNTVQPAVSRQIRTLEEELGTQLFDRHGRGMVPTEAGRKAINGALRIMAELEQMKSDVADEQLTLRGRVTVGMLPVLTDLLAVPLIQALRRQHPGLQLELMSGFTGHLRDWMQRGEADMTLSYEHRRGRLPNVRPLLREKLFLVGPSAASLSLKRPVPFSVLGEGIELVLPLGHHLLSQMIAAAAAKTGVRLHTSVKVDSLSAIRQLIQSGIGWTILPLAPVQVEVAAGRLSAAPLCRPTLYRQLVLSNPSERRPTRAMRVVADLIVEIVASMAKRKIIIGDLLV